MKRPLLLLAVLLALGLVLYAGLQLRASSHKPPGGGLRPEGYGLEPGPKTKKGEAAMDLRDGDIVFQDMEGGQSEAIALATGSKWTHVGIVFQVDGEPWVFEAVGPVKRTPLSDWIAQGAGGHCVAKRWTEAAQRLDAAAVAKLRAATERFMGLAYDWQFGWDDSKIYCSELVWKLYDEGLGVQLCAPKPMRDHNLNSELVRATMQQRYGGAPPLDELMIAPGALFDCPLLVTVAER